MSAEAVAAPGAPAAPQTGAGKWVVAGTVLFGTFLAVMDLSVVNVSLPHMMGSFGATQSSITWVATSYSIAEIVMLTMAGWWSTVLGRKRLYLMSFGLFMFGSMLAGTAQTFTQMLVYRALQGVGGGSLIPISQAILRETFPPREQGMAMAIYGMGVVLAPGMAPILGGWLTDQYGWPWIFYINVPFSIVGMLMVSAFVQDPPYLRRGIRRIDYKGIILLTIGLTGMQLVLERGQQENWFESNWIVGGAVITLIALALLVIQELRTDEPVVNFRLLRDVPLMLGSVMGLVFGIALFGTTFVLPQLTQNLLGYPAFESGLVLSPRVLTMLLVMPIAGWLYNRVDPRILVTIGVLTLYVSYVQLAGLSLEVSFWNLVPMLLLMGAGMPFMFVTMSTISLSRIAKADMTEASGLYTLARRVGGNIGYALVATLVASRSLFHRGHLISNVNPFAPSWREAQAAITAHLGQLPQPYDAATAGQQALALVNATVERQARIMAYNDISWFMGIMFLFVLPLIFFLPRRREVQQRMKEEEGGGGR
ncbi:MAG: DHA2 family efflux MFS transporter permease subunit [Acidobacteriota bacterium]